jgi:DNA adenine methylase
VEKISTLKGYNKIIAFPWYGGKYSHLSWLLPLLPECEHYVEPFGGSASVLLNRKPSEFETYNDLNGDVVNFFRVLREKKDELIGGLRLTPWSREEYEIAIRFDDGLGDVEKARRFFTAVRQSFMSIEGERIPSNWSHTVNFRRPNGKLASRYCPRVWQNGIDELEYVAKRLLNVQIENRPALYVIKTYESPGTFFYVDPPYVMESRTGGKAYSHEMSLEDHKELAEALNGCKCKVALSAYEHPIVDEFYPAPKWRKIKSCPKPTTGGALRTEVLYTNYDPTKKTVRLF